MDIYKDRILPLFLKSGMNDQQLEHKIGLPRGTLYNWKMNRVKSYKKYCGQIASYFHVSTDYLLGNTDDPTPTGQKETPPTQGGGLSEKDARLIQWFRSLPPEKQRAILIAQDGPEDAVED